MVLAGRQDRRRLVLACDAAARSLGIRPGMALAQARAMTSALFTQEADPEGDRAGLDRLALWALRLYAPVAAADPPDGLVIDVTGASHRYGGEKGLLEDMILRLEASGVNARAALAETWGCAHALARYGSERLVVVEPGGVGRALGALPVRALRVSEAMADALGKIGVDRVSEAEALARASLALRFGQELLLRLDQAYGRTAETIDPVEAQELIQVRRTLPAPVSAPEPLARLILSLTVQLCAALEEKSLGARQLDLRLHRVDNRIEAVRVGAARPVRDAKRLARLLCDRLEGVDPGFGIETLVLTAPRVEPLVWRPGAGDLMERPKAEVTDLIDILSNRLGGERLYRMTPAESDVPERCARKIAPAAPPIGTTWPGGWPRPARLLASPEPIQTVALLPDQPPVSFTWRGVRRRVKRADGPERIFGEWWRRGGEEDAVRDYFQIEDEVGARFWVFRRGDGERPASGDLCWFLHGLFG